MHSRKRINKKTNTAWVITAAAISLSMITLSLTYVVLLNTNVEAAQLSSDNSAKAKYMSVAQVVGREALVNPAGVKSKEASQQSEAKNPIKNAEAVKITETVKATETNKTATGGEKGSVKEHKLSQNSRLVNYMWHPKEGEIQDAKVFIYEPEQFNGHTVCVDAGHGANSHPTATQKKEKVYPVEDSKLASMNTSMVGAKAYDYGVEARDSKNVYDKKETEPEYTLKVALMVKDKLLAKGYRVVLTRNDASQNLSNGARAVLAGETSDIMVSIHTNASTSKMASGTLTFYPGDKDYMDGGMHPGYTQIMGIDKDVDKSKRLAELMADNVSSSAGFSNKGAHSAILRIFSYSSIPVSLVEVGFSDYATDAKILTERKEQVANGIVKGIDEYFSGQ